MASSTLSVPNLSRKMSTKQESRGMTPAPSLLSLRSVIDFMPNDIRLRYKDAAKHTVWPECPLDGNGQAVEINEEDELTDNSSNSGLGGKLKRNLTLTNGLATREYLSKFGNAPVVLAPSRNRRTSERAGATYPSFSPTRAGPSVAYFSSKDGGDVNVRLMSVEMTRL